jgi:hypothetical protein
MLHYPSLEQCKGMLGVAVPAMDPTQLLPQNPNINP